MARRTTTGKSRGQAEPSDPHSMAALLGDFLEYSQVRGFAARTVKNRRVCVSSFIAWCAERSLHRPGEVTRPVLQSYQRWLFHYRKVDGQPLSFRSQNARLVPVRAFFKWLARDNHILYNPASDLELPRAEKRLPRHVLSAREAEQVLTQAGLGRALGLRDRAILEILYSTGIRRMELISLKLDALDFERRTVMVRQGKGRKDRLLPIGERALSWTLRYISDLRPLLVVPPDLGTLFLTGSGRALSPNRLSDLVRGYVDAAEIGKQGSCHLLRHTMATLMLEQGADIRYVQAMLGHADLSTTQIYTRVSIRKLQEVHSATHPANAKRRARRGGSRPEEGAPAKSMTREELLETLVAEAAQDQEEEQ